ncbi:MAG: SDR family oxidoreductase [Bacteroidales bacterium]
MKILLTGVTGYIGKRLLPVLIEAGHEVFCVVRDKNRFDKAEYPSPKLHLIEGDFLDYHSLKSIPVDLDVAYYFIHSMSASIHNFNTLEKTCAENFRHRINETRVKQVIYLSGIINEQKLSAHLESRKSVENILAAGSYHLTTLRAGIIVGAGSSSFEIIRDLVEKLPVMIAPKWLNTKTQPIAISNVIQYLKGVLLYERTFDDSFDIGGPEILTYKEMLLKLAKVRGLKRYIITLPVMTPRLSSYWLYFVTSTSYKLAINLVNSMKVEVVSRENRLPEWFNFRLLTYEEAVRMAFDKIEQQEVLSSWTDALSRNMLETGVDRLLRVPTHGCFRDIKIREIKDEEKTLNRIWSIGGNNGWYYANWLWEIRGLIDKASGGVGLRRGRKNRDFIKTGETLDFWRVLYASRDARRLLLYAEMKLPGEAWLEFKIREGKLYQTATFRPKGLWGRIYWYTLYILHYFIFKGMSKQIAR